MAISKKYNDEQLKPLISEFIKGSTAEGAELVRKYAKPGVVTAGHMTLALKALDNPENNLNAHYAKKIADTLIRVAIEAQDTKIISKVLSSRGASELIESEHLELAKEIHNNTSKPIYKTQDKKTTGEERAKEVTTAYRIFAGLLQKSSNNVMEQLASKHKVMGIVGLASEVNNELERRKQIKPRIKLYKEAVKVNQKADETKEILGPYTSTVRRNNEKQTSVSL